MINADLFWMFLLPIVLSIAGVFILPKTTRGAFNTLQAVGFSAFALFLGCAILTAAFYIGKGSKTHDTEIWNGEIVSKTREHGSYVESYQCNCRSVTTGSGKNQTTTQVCDTCYRDHYTVDWSCNSNIGHFGIDHKDWTSSSVYNEPDPARYTIIKKGDPVSAEHSYTNYIKAVPESLFRPLSSSLKAQYAGQVPAYPINIYDIYHVDRVIGVGVPIPDLRDWNMKLSEVLKKLGPAKQANAVIVITKSSDPNYFYALQDAWLNGKKNDIVIVIGAPEFPKKAAWVNVMALAQDAIFQVKMRDDILALDTLTADSVTQALSAEAMATFKRKHMRDFAYLDGEIDPPTWVMVTSMIFVLLAYVGFWFYAHKQFVPSSRRNFR
jgi:hypothetical protein